MQTSLDLVVLYCDYYTALALSLTGKQIFNENNIWQHKFKIEYTHITHFNSLSYRENYKLQSLDNLGIIIYGYRVLPFIYQYNAIYMNIIQHVGPSEIHYIKISTNHRYLLLIYEYNPHIVYTSNKLADVKDYYSTNYDIETGNRVIDITKMKVISLQDYTHVITQEVHLPARVGVCIQQYDYSFEI